MQVENLSLAGLKLLRPEIYSDNRGYFLESYNQSNLAAFGIKDDFVQDNISFSLAANTIRGLHAQKAPYGQSKLVSVLNGKIWDVVVDIRPDSPSFGSWLGVTLCSEKREQLYIPEGFLHGFITLVPNVVISYKCGSNYNKNSEIGVVYNDSSLNISWPVDGGQVILSEKDASLGEFAALVDSIKA